MDEVKPYHIVLAVLVIAGVIIAFNWAKFKSWIDSIGAPASPVSHVDGTACTTTEGKAGAYKSDVCVATIVPPVQIQIPVQIKITSDIKPYYRNPRGKFIVDSNATTIKAGTVLTVTGVDANPITFYQTPLGWIRVNFATV